MKRLHFALIGAAALALAACGGREEDTLGDNVGENLQADELNALADDAAQDANAEMEALGNQQEQLNEETTNTDDGVTTEPSEVEDDVQGM
jgi:hypothetical protein